MQLQIYVEPFIYLINFSRDVDCLATSGQFVPPWGPATIGPGHSLLIAQATKLGSLLYETVKTKAPSEKDLVQHEKDLPLLKDRKTIYIHCAYVTVKIKTNYTLVCHFHLPRITANHKSLFFKHNYQQPSWFMYIPVI